MIRNGEAAVTVEKDISKIAAALNENREAIASAAGVSAKDLCEARVESGRLVLVPVK